MEEMMARTQVTAYLDKDVKNWLTKYAAKFHIKESEVIRLLVEREMRVMWLCRAISQPEDDEAA